MLWRRLEMIRTVDLLWNILIGVTVMLIAGKAVGLIEWPWWAVLSPFLVPFSIAWMVFIGLFVFWFCVIMYHQIRKLTK